jgi:hypothetical protein
MLSARMLPLRRFDCYLHKRDVTEPFTMDKPRNRPVRALADAMRTTLNAAFAKQGFASTELVTRWVDIVGEDIAAHSEPEKIQWPRPIGEDMPQPGTLVLRVEGPAAIEIQHMSRVLLERVNQFFGWQAVDTLRLRQAPLSRRKRPPQRGIDADAQAGVAATLTGVSDSSRRDALSRLGAAVKTNHKHNQK